MKTLIYLFFKPWVLATKHLGNAWFIVPALYMLIPMLLLQFSTGFVSVFLGLVVMIIAMVFGATVVLMAIGGLFKP